MALMDSEEDDSLSESAKAYYRNSSWYPVQAKVRFHDQVYLISSPYNTLDRLRVEQVEGSPNEFFLKCLRYYVGIEHDELRGAYFAHAAVEIAKIVSRDLGGTMVWYSGQDRPTPKGIPDIM